MENYRTLYRQKSQKKYRQSQANKGLVRFELQINAESKAQFDAMVQAVAEEYQTPWDNRRRIAKARVQIFDEITQGITHEFTALTQKIQALKNEIKALSPNFFITDLPDKTPLPEAIEALPDNPQQLKQLLAKTYRDAQQAKMAAIHHKRHSDQYRELYEVTTDHNNELKRRLKDQDMFVEE